MKKIKKIKKQCIIAIVAMISGFAVAQVNVGMASSIIGETIGVTNYIGIAHTNEKDTATPDTNASIWRIIKTVYDASGNVVSMKNAYGTADGDNSLWSTAWTNRVNATYR